MQATKAAAKKPITGGTMPSTVKVNKSKTDTSIFKASSLLTTRAEMVTEKKRKIIKNASQPVRKK